MAKNFRNTAEITTSQRNFTIYNLEEFQFDRYFHYLNIQRDLHA